MKPSNRFLTPLELCLYPMLAILLFCSKLMMEFLPNIHLLGMLIMTYTVVFRTRALIPVFLYVFLNGLWAGFSLWWLPYLYLWPLLWGMTMLLPRQLPLFAKRVVYPLVCALHGLLFGVLYAPAQALLFSLDWQGTVAWVLAGLPFDLLHAVGNLLFGCFILPCSNLCKRLLQRTDFYHTYPHLK